MDQYLSVISVIAIIFTAMVLQLAAKPQITKKLTSYLVVIAAIGGFIFYGYGYAYRLDNPMLAILQGLLSVCGIFVGKIEEWVIADTPLYNNRFIPIIFWLLHVFALYATASATIAAIGADTLRRLRLWMARRGQLHLIFGVTPDTLDFAKELDKKPKSAVVFVDKSGDANHIAAVAKIGCVLRTDASAIAMRPQFLKSVGVRPGKRHITLYALSNDSVENLRCASNFLASAQSMHIQPQQTSLVLSATESTAVGNLQVLTGVDEETKQKVQTRYGYGYVTAFHPSGLAARQLVHAFPPCDTITFDENGKATEDFHALIVGFGLMGQAVLQQLVMNSQFVGSHFRCAIFSPDCQKVDGLLSSDCKEMLRNYDISLHPYDARSKEFYEYLAANASSLKYIVLCTNSAKLNRELSDDLLLHFQRTSLQIPVHQCSYSSVTRQISIASLPEDHKLYTPDMLCTDETDRMAMILNHYYMGKPKPGEPEYTALEHWMECNYFNRMSSRAATDFMPALLRAAGMTEQDVLQNGWTPSAKMLENLSITEHMRWCAFHYAMGIGPMSDEEFQARCEAYRAGKIKKISNNIPGRTHACLVDWDQLDELSEKENRVTGGNRDYKQSDTDNVLLIPTLLKIKHNISEKA